MRHILPAALLAFLLAGPPASAQDIAKHPRVQQALTLLDMWLEAERAYEQLPGISAALVHDQNVLWTRGFGYADVEKKLPATPSTIYSICSISKLFTSIALMQLRDAGKVRLDDPVSKHLPWFRVKQSYAESPDIRVEDLLTHRAGFEEDPPFPMWTGDFTFPTREQIVATISDNATIFPAQRYFEYSNLGLVLAGEVVAAAAGQSYADYVTTNVVAPLRMTSTTLDVPTNRARLATGYSAVRRDGTRVAIPYTPRRGYAAAAGFASTAEDLARFAAWQFRVLGSSNGEVLSGNTLREMQRVHFIDPDWTTTRGLGFEVRRVNDKTLVGHGGDCPGYRTAIQLQPDEKIAAIFMANTNGVNQQQLAQRIYEIAAPAIRAAVADTSHAIKQDTSLLRYQGFYDMTPWAGEALVLAWEDGLAMIELPSRNPLAEISKLRRDGDKPNAFRRVREDGVFADRVTFDVAPNGSVLRFWRWNNPFQRK
jgi:CubicO group peptidase (beta-lactamase class C family)